MDAQKSTPAVVAASLAILAVGTAAGALIGDKLGKSSGDPLAQSALTFEGAIFGTLAAAFAGIVLTASSKKWRPIGETTAAIGVGAPLILATVGLVKQVRAAEAGQIAAASGQTYTVGQSNSGQSITMSVGDTLVVNLAQGMPQPTASADGTLVYGGSSDVTVSGSTLTSYEYTGGTAGTVTLTATGTPTGTAATGTTATPTTAQTTFTLTVVVQ